MSKPTYTQFDIAQAARAWDTCGSMGLGSWFARNREKCAGDYGALVKAVRRYLQDFTDYSKEASE